MLKMSGHAKKLSDLRIVIPNQLGIHRVLQSLPPSYKNFVMNYNMQNMNKELPELFSMPKSAEVEIQKEHQVLMVNKTTSFKKQGKPNHKGHFKKGGKKAVAPPEKPKTGPKPDTVCYYCKEKGHWKRNCPKYLADLKRGHIKKKVDTTGNTRASEGKIFVAKNGSFLEKEFLMKEVTGRKVELDEVDEPSIIDQSSAVPEDVPAQPAPIGEEANDDDHETSNEEAIEPRRSRERTTPDWYDPCLNVMIVDNNDEDPATKRTPDEAEELLAKIGQNHDDWTTPEPTPTPILKNRGLIKLNDEDMREAKKSLKEKGLLNDFLTLVGKAGLTAYMEDEREQYHMLTKIFVESFKFNNKHYHPTVTFKIYGNTVTMKLEEFCIALDIDPVGTTKRIEDNPRALLELYREITNDDCRTIQRGKIRNIQLPAIKYFAYYLATSILGRENTSNISSYHLAFLIAALTEDTPYHLGALVARRLSSRGPIFGGIIASRILAYLDLPLDPTDVQLTPIRLDIAAMKSHQFVTTDSSLDNMVYRMLFLTGMRGSPFATDLFSVDKKPWSRSKEEVDEQLKI
ncbi:hypothetical protein QYE76_050643 [Lolium multiflorum]|uniref:CCHC-type domain-containing protein n=1 Tax=Lolium multiflorum TaxID=4521 RepID=A0AAD8WHH2_LOLMU|nr:hypothetical protein QYE76_050643 [Lolium multiflorum]